MMNGLESINSGILIVLIIEIGIAYHIFQRSKKSNKVCSSAQIQLLVPNQLAHLVQTRQNAASKAKSVSISQYQILQLIHQKPQTPHSKSWWASKSVHVCTFSVFLIAFLLLNYLLQPYANSWALNLLPGLLPIPFMTLPSSFRLRPYSALICLLCGLSLGFFQLILL